VPEKLLLTIKEFGKYEYIDTDKVYYLDVTKENNPYRIVISEKDALQIVNRFILYRRAPITAIHANSNYIIDKHCLEWLKLHTTLESIIINAEYTQIFDMDHAINSIIEGRNQFSIRAFDSSNLNYQLNFDLNTAREIVEKTEPKRYTYEIVEEHAYNEKIIF